MLRLLTAGESHGKAMLATIDGFPAGLTIDESGINRELERRQGGYGRGGRQKLETDRVEFLSGTWQQTTLGSPLCLQVINRDYKLERLKELPRPRPGHGDLTGSLKYLSSIRGILERASARETAARVAAGALASQLLRSCGIRVFGFVRELGEMRLDPPQESIDLASVDGWVSRRDQSSLYSLDPDADDRCEAYIDQTAKDGDTLGGIVEVHVLGAPFGLGSHTQWDRKLDGQLAQAVMSIQAFKGVEIGLGFEAARRPGSEVHDPIHFDATFRDARTLGYQRPTNHAGGLEAGMTNGQPIVVRGAMKPISTLRKPLESIQMDTKEPSTASYERSDICAVSAASVIAENVVAFEIAVALTDKFGNDSIEEITERITLFHRMAANI